MIENASIHVGVLLLDLHIPAARSLKDKRRLVKSLKDRVFARLRVSIAEVGALDKWQRSVVGISMIANDKVIIDRCFQEVMVIVQGYPEIELLESRMELL